MTLHFFDFPLTSDSDWPARVTLITSVVMLTCACCLPSVALAEDWVNALLLFTAAWFALSARALKRLPRGRRSLLASERLSRAGLRTGQPDSEV